MRFAFQTVESALPLIVEEVWKYNTILDLPYYYYLNVIVMEGSLKFSFGVESIWRKDFSIILVLIFSLGIWFRERDGNNGNIWMIGFYGCFWNLIRVHSFYFTLLMNKKYLILFF